MYFFKQIPFIFLTFLTSCSFYNADKNESESSFRTFIENSSTGWVGVYRPDIVQGNYVTSKMVGQLIEGQTKKQVMEILGTPLIVDPFNPNKWNYVFNLKQKNLQTSSRIFFVEFKQNKLLRWGGKTANEEDERVVSPF